MPSSLEKAESCVFWRQAEDALKRCITLEEIDAWFENVCVLDYREELIILGVPSGYRREYVEKNYRGLLANIFSSLLNRQIDVEIRLTSPMNEKADFEEISVITNPGKKPIMQLFEPLQYEPLNESYTFDNFVIGGCNKMAHAAAEAVAKAPAQSYNPLFIYGGVGLGKTHLLQAIGNAIKTSIHSNKQVAYLSAEQFVNIFIDAIKRNERLSFQAAFRNVDVLLIDDIQFLAGKESTQEEFFHTFNALHNKQKQIVISSDRPPKDIPTIEDRLRSRFEWGLIVDIVPPDFELRMAILRQKCEHVDPPIPDNVLEFIASKIRSSIRELEGALAKITAHAQFTNEDLDLEIAGKVLGEIYDRGGKEISIEKIQRKVAEHFNIKPADIIGKNRSRSIARPRQIAMYLSRKLTRHSFPEIGTFFGNKDHTTVLFACNKIEKEMEGDSKLRSIVQDLSDSFSM
ncbi:MAG: chromosomal replication initiator protein DnaA [Candidatus Omnitrophota bacterium]|nr:MAG: chromosomal replication initiator protein DnaA [Candidatus Omnitrophota bacterium]